MSLITLTSLNQVLPFYPASLDERVGIDQKAVPEPKKNFQVNIFSEFSAKGILSPEQVVADLSQISGPLDVYFWYEGAINLPVSGAQFMKERILKPLYLAKQDYKPKLYPYSLRAWDFNQRGNAATSSDLSNAINRINRTAVECIQSSSFFEYCRQIRSNGLYDYLSRELPENKPLIKLSLWRKKTGLKVEEFFNFRPSLFDSIKTFYLNSAYSLLQYVEGYYLIQRSVRNGLYQNLKKIEIAIVLPNNEFAYYKSLPKDIESMLSLDFGDELKDVEINITFKFFKFGNKLDARPYMDKESDEVTPEQIPSYFDFIKTETFMEDECKQEQKNAYIKVKP